MEETTILNKWSLYINDCATATMKYNDPIRVLHTIDTSVVLYNGGSKLHWNTFIIEEGGTSIKVRVKHGTILPDIFLSTGIIEKMKELDVELNEITLRASVGGTILQLEQLIFEGTDGTKKAYYSTLIDSLISIRRSLNDNTKQEEESKVTFSPLGEYLVTCLNTSRLTNMYRVPIYQDDTSGVYVTFYDGVYRISFERISGYEHFPENKLVLSSNDLTKVIELEEKIIGFRKGGPIDIYSCELDLLKYLDGQMSRVQATLMSPGGNVNQTELVELEKVIENIKDRTEIE